MSDKVACSTCGQTFSKFVMFRTFTGRVQYQCPKCYLKGQSDAGQNVQRRYAAIQKQKRNK